MHQGMGLQHDRGDDLPPWSMSDEFPRIVYIAGDPGELRIHPWLFRDRVLELWEQHPNLFTAINPDSWQYEDDDEF